MKRTTNDRLLDDLVRAAARALPGHLAPPDCFLVGDLPADPRRDQGRARRMEAVTGWSWSGLGKSPVLRPEKELECLRS